MIKIVNVKITDFKKEMKKQIPPGWAKKAIKEDVTFFIQILKKFGYDIKEKVRCRILENTQRIELFELSSKTSSKSVIDNIREENIKLKMFFKNLK